MFLYNHPSRHNHYSALGQERRLCSLRGTPPPESDPARAMWKADMEKATDPNAKEKKGDLDLEGIQGYEKGRMEHLMGQYKRKEFKHKLVGWNKSPDIMSIANDTRRALTLGIGVTFPLLGGAMMAGTSLGKWVGSKFTKNPKSLKQSIEETAQFPMKALEGSGRLVKRHPWQTLKATVGNTVKAGQHLYIDTVGDWVEDVLRARGHDADTGLISALFKAGVETASDSFNFIKKIPSAIGGTLKWGGDVLGTVFKEGVKHPILTPVGLAIGLTALSGNAMAIAGPAMNMIDQVVGLVVETLSKGVSLMGT